MGSRKKDSSAAVAAPFEDDERLPWSAAQDKDDGTTFVLDAQGDAIALILCGGLEVARPMAASRDLLSAAQKVLDGLNARKDE